MYSARHKHAVQVLVHYLITLAPGHAAHGFGAVLRDCMELCRGSERHLTPGHPRWSCIHVRAFFGLPIQVSDSVVTRFNKKECVFEKR